MHARTKNADKLTSAHAQERAVRPRTRDDHGTTYCCLSALQPRDDKRRKTRERKRERER